MERFYQKSEYNFLLKALDKNITNFVMVIFIILTKGIYKKQHIVVKVPTLQTPVQVMKKKSEYNFKF